MSSDSDPPSGLRPPWKPGALSLTTLLLSVLMAAVFAAVFGWMLWRKEAQYQTYAYDLGLFTQVAWNTLHGHPFATTLLAFNYLADHFAPSLALVAPLFLFWPDARALLLVQAAAMAAAGIGIFLATWQRTGDGRAALLIQLAYHLAPVTAWVALDEFHPISLAVPALTFATYLLWRRRYALAAGCAALTLLSTEDAVAWAVPFGLLLAAIARGRDRRWGLLLSAGAVAWITAYLFLLVPALRPPALVQSDPHPDIGVFVYCGRTWSAVAGCLLQHPSSTVHQLLRPAGGDVLAAILGPTAGLGLLGPSFLVVAGRWVVQLLGVGPANYTQHYVALLVPAAYLAAGEASGWLRCLRVLPRMPAALVAVASLIAYLHQSPLPGGGGYAAPGVQQRARSALVDRAVALVPTDPHLSVVATSEVFPHVALRPGAYLPWAAPSSPVDYMVLDLRDAYPISEQRLHDLATVWLADADYQVLLDQDDVVVLKHGYRPPPVASEATFDNTIRLLGFGVERRNGALEVQLTWRALQAPGDEYHFFVHLVDGVGHTIGQQDGPPIPGAPAFVWPAGRALRTAVSLPAPLQAGPMHLEVGWYNWHTNQRLPLADGSDHATIPLPGE